MAAPEFTTSRPDLPEARGAIAGIVAVSVAASGFLFWLLYFRQAPPQFARSLTFLPALNAVFNGLSAAALTLGFIFILRRQVVAHQRSMMAAFVFSTLFLLSYILHHALHGDVRFPADAGGARTVYLLLLASHVLLSVVALPMVLITFFLSLSGRFAAHRRLARYTFPIWLYVSVTGVVVYAMLAAYVPAG
ncbi:MAG: DUF420 domain-containing protein [Rhodospirillales bacterium]|nr:DUF420 domain-containing protein [Acetobacter sp.]